MSTDAKELAGKNRLHSKGISTLHYVAYNDSRVEESQSIDLQQTGADDGRVHWSHIDGLGDHALINAVAGRYGIHSLLLEDILNAKQRPKLEDYADSTYIVAKLVSFDAVKKRISSEQISLVLGKNYLLSFREKPSALFDGVRERIRSGKGRIRSQKSDYLAYTLLDTIVDEYFVVVEALREQIDLLQSRLLTKSDPQIPKVIHQVRLEVASFRRGIWPLQKVVEQLLKSESSLIDPQTKPYFRDVHDHLLRILDHVEALHETLNSIIDAYLSLSSQRMNEIMKVLTLFSTIFLPLTFIVGVYGMNFKYMPELEWRFGYPLTWLVMIGVATGLGIYFQRKKWL